MKTRLFLLALCLFFSQLSFSSSLDSNLIKKRWKITSHTKKNKAIAHHENDFFQFNHSGFLEQVAEGMYLTGKWNLDVASNLLRISTAEGASEWTITELTPNSLKASYKNEILVMEAVTLKICHGDPYADETMICGKWKVANHIAHYSRVSYSPFDYIHFFEDGTVEEVFKGRYKKMTWKYEDGKLIVSDVIWNIKDLDPKELKADISSKNETIVLKKL